MGVNRLTGINSEAMSTNEHGEYERHRRDAAPVCPGVIFRHYLSPIKQAALKKALGCSIQHRRAVAVGLKNCVNVAKGILPATALSQRIDVVCADNHQRFPLSCRWPLKLHLAKARNKREWAFLGHDKRRNSHFAGNSARRNLHKRQRHHAFRGPG